jgi:hypothetical protein
MTHLWYVVRRGKALVSADGVMVVGTEAGDPLDGTFPGSGGVAGVAAAIASARGGVGAVREEVSGNGVWIIFSSALAAASNGGGTTHAARSDHRARTTSTGSDAPMTAPTVAAPSFTPPATRAWWLPFGPTGAAGMFRGAAWLDGRHRTAAVAVGSSLLVLTLPRDAPAEDWPASGHRAGGREPLFALAPLALAPLHALTEVLSIGMMPGGAGSASAGRRLLVGRFGGSLQCWSWSEVAERPCAPWTRDWEVVLEGGAVTGIASKSGGATGAWAITECGLLHDVTASGRVRAVVDTQVAPLFALAPLECGRRFLLGSGDGKVVLHTLDTAGEDAEPLALIDPRVAECASIEVAGNVAVVAGAEAATMWCLTCNDHPTSSSGGSVAPGHGGAPPTLALAGHVSCRPGGATAGAGASRPGLLSSDAPPFGLDYTTAGGANALGPPWRPASLVAIPTVLPACEFRRRGKVEATLVPGAPHLLVTTTSYGQVRVTDLTRLPPLPADQPLHGGASAAPWRQWAPLPAAEVRLQALVTAADV